MASPLIYADGALYPLCEGHPCHCREDHEDMALDDDSWMPDNNVGPDDDVWTAEDEDALEEWEHRRRERLAERLEY
jgi:hypothetical protein